MNNTLTIRERIVGQVKNSCTPDMSLLRYHKAPFLVFLSDEMMDYRTRALCIPQLEYKDLEPRYFSTTTVEKYHAFYNTDPCQWQFDSFIFPTTEPVEYLDVEEVSDKPRHLYGKLFSASLKGLQHLDFYYDNSTTFIRRKIQVRKTPASKEVVVAYAYINRVKSIADWNSLNKTWVPHKNISLAPWKIQDGNDGVYRY